MAGLEPFASNFFANTDPDSVLGHDVCLTLLASRAKARLAVSLNALPNIVLVGYRMIEFNGSLEIVVLIQGHTRLLDAFRDSVVAAEVDELDLDDQVGWVVLVQGRSRVITDPDQIASALAAFDLKSDTTHRFAAISPDRLHGRYVKGCPSNSAL